MTVIKVSGGSYIVWWRSERGSCRDSFEVLFMLWLLGRALDDIEGWPEWALPEGVTER